MPGRREERDEGKAEECEEEEKKKQRNKKKISEEKENKAGYTAIQSRTVGQEQ